jgi:NUMOD4 motif/HNH endonuclease
MAYQLLPLPNKLHSNSSEVTKIDLDQPSHFKTEIWKDIEGYEKFYEVSNLGRVRSFDRLVKTENPNIAHPSVRTVHSQILAPSNRAGYPRLCLCKEGQKKYFYVHRLVATAFIPNPENKPQVNHINGIKANNNVENLEWLTARDNQIHAYKTGLNISPRSVDRCNAKLSPATIHRAKTLREIGYVYKKIAELVGVSYTTIHLALNGKTWKT